jgi:hypothetical protein
MPCRSLFRNVSYDSAPEVGGYLRKGVFTKLPSLQIVAPSKQACQTRIGGLMLRSTYHGAVLAAATMI